MPTPVPYPHFTGTEPCATVGSDHFFTTDEQPAYTNLPMVKAICRGCDMRDACLNYALHTAVHGIWGGTTEHERQAVRREYNIVPVALMHTYDTAPPTRAAAQKRQQRAARRIA